MTNRVVVIEYFERCYGSETKQAYKVFDTIRLWEEYCSKNGIQILKGAFGSTYNDESYNYVVNHVEYIK